MSGSVDRLKGSVKWFDRWRGFGFITPEGSGVDLFVHSSSIKAVGRRWLTAGQSVEFFVSIGSDGRSSAVSVTAPPSSSSQKAWCYFRGACFHCNEVGHIARDCKSNDATRSLGSYHSDRGFPATQPTNTLKPLKLASLSLLPDKEETPVGQISEGLNSVVEEVEESEVRSEYNECRSGTEWRNWAELPRDTLFIIFKKIAAAEILSSAQFVCRPWRQLSHEPALWRCVDLRNDDYFSVGDLVSMARLVVDRSKGCMEELTMHCFPTNEAMRYVAERATRLRGLHLISAGIYEGTLVETLRKLPLLEELEVSRCFCFSNEVLEKVGQACPQLKSFRLDKRVYNPQFLPENDSDNIGALAIAKHFKQLRRLRLFANCLTNTGLLAILVNCPHLEHLDIRYCFNVDFGDENLKNKCAGIKDLRLPNDSIADYDE
ncbi:putative F-box/LRR-repeat protein 23 [Platanthera zijinensis]|uniref:F-box/LRR-repeat protein 23 n=1 Tax=Platanthera zijinensis TaxID=2320716 RepID=A0AAP0BVD2_9ASPA